MQFGRKLRSLLWEHGIAPTEFAAAVGVTPGYLSKILRTAEPNPSSDVFCRILLGFGLFEAPLSPDEIAALVRARYNDEVHREQECLAPSQPPLTPSSDATWANDSDALVPSTPSAAQESAV